MSQHKRKVIPMLYLLLACLTAEFQANAQHCDSLVNNHCNALNRSPAGIMVGHTHPKGNWMLSYRYMFMNMKNNQQGTQPVSGQTVFSDYLMSPTYMQMNMHMVMGMYGLTDKVSIMAMLHYQALTMQMKMFTATTHQHGGVEYQPSDGYMDMNTSGLSDSKVYVSYTVTETKTHSLVLSAGVNIPTGSVKLKGETPSMYPNSRLPYMMQTGSGTVDFMPGITYNHTTGKWQWGFQGTGVYRPFYNPLGYHLGNEGGLTTWGAYRLLKPLSVSARLEATYQGAIDGRDVTLFSRMEPAAYYKNYGGNRFNAYVGCSFGGNEGWLAGHKLSVEGGLPVYQNVNGIQLAQQANLFAAWIVSF